MLTMVHANPARLQDGVFYVDRKFHTGMQEYVRCLNTPILAVHPHLSPEYDASIMDLVAVPESELGYRVKTVKCSDDGGPLPEEIAPLRTEIARSKVVYCGGLGRAVRDASVQTGVPYIGIVEKGLWTNVALATYRAKGIVRKTWRILHTAGHYFTEVVPFVRGARLLHCNGYPVFNEMAQINQNRLLYLDSRLHDSMLITPAGLRDRLARRRSRVPRVIFSGRLEPEKGALDIIKIACQPVLRNVPCEFIIYGKGTQRAAMERLVAEEGLLRTVKIVDPIPFPQLVEASRECDIFLCCHPQGDPSCTYLESMGCGLPILGYANAMWSAMQADSGAGLVTGRCAPAEAAKELRKLLADPDRLDDLSLRAHSFAAKHTFEAEFARRTDSMKELIFSNTV